MASPALTGDALVATVGVIASMATMARRQAPPILALVGDPFVAPVVEFARPVGVEHGL